MLQFPALGPPSGQEEGPVLKAQIERTACRVPHIPFRDDIPFRDATGPPGTMKEGPGGINTPASLFSPSESSLVFSIS